MVVSLIIINQVYCTVILHKFKSKLFRRKQDFHASQRLRSMRKGYGHTYSQCNNGIFVLIEQAISDRLVAEARNVSLLRYHYIFCIKFVDFSSQMPYFNQGMSFPANSYI